MAELGDRGRDGWIRVWDPFVRIFHWSMVGLVTLAFFTDADRAVHDTAGYVVLALVLARVVWGFIGSEHARFRDFVPSPGRLLRYVAAVGSGGTRRYLGHNPAGGAMIVALLALLLVTIVSGWLSETDAFFGVSWVSHLHHRAAHLLLPLVGLHVLGVVISSRMHGDNLVLAMITGNKRRKSGGLAGAQAQPENGAAARTRADHHRAAMGGRDLADDRQTKSRAG